MSLNISIDPRELADNAATDTNETQSISASILMMLALMVVNQILLNLVKRAKLKYPVLTKYVQDAAITTLLGISLICL
jgi:hypothetical protein